MKAGFMLSITFISLFPFFWHELFNYRLQIINTIWNRKQIIQGRRGEEQKGVYQSQINSDGNPPWKIGAAFLSSSRFSSGRFRHQSSSKLWVVCNSAFAGATRRTTHFELTLDFGKTVLHFHFPFTWGTRLTTMTTRFTRRSSNGHIVNLPLLHDSRNANTTLRC